MQLLSYFGKQTEPGKTQFVCYNESMLQAFEAE